MTKMRHNIVIWLIIVNLIGMLLSSISAIAEPIGWSEDINLTLDDDMDSRKATIGVFENNIHVVWADSRHYPVTDAPEIYYKNSTDGGKTWNPEVRLTYIESLKNYPRIAVDGNNIHIIWTDSRDGGGTRIYYKNSTDGGNTWSADKRISPLSTDIKVDYTDIAVNGCNIHVAYADNFTLKYINSTDNGITWGEPQQLTGSNRDSHFPAIAINGSNIHIVWTDYFDRFGVGTAGSIFYMNSSDGGLTWSEDFNLTPKGQQSGYPDIAVDGNNVHVTYFGQRNELRQICYRRSVDKGITWTEEFMISNSPEDIYNSVMKISGNNIYVAWADPKNQECEIYLRNSSDNGKNWYDETRMTYDPAFCGYSDIAIENESLHLVWSDWRDGAPEIYYKYYPFYPPPTNLTIDIWGTNLTLNWTTPKDSPSPLDHYLIYRENDLKDFDFLDVWINTTVDKAPGEPGPIPLRTSWNDTTALLDESTDYYYVVRAVYENGEIDTNENIVGKFVTPLNSGWNLFSLPLTQNDTNIPEVLKSIDMNYNVIWIYDAKEARWRSSTIDLTDINRTMGLWIYMKQKYNLSVVGTVPESTDIFLYEGWNLVGYPSLKTRDLSDALNGISWTTVWTYDVSDINDLWKVNNTSKPTQLNDLEEMKPGCGYWVYVTINDTWVRTRVVDDNKMVVWKVYGLEEKEDQHGLYEPIIENPIETEKEDSFKVDRAPARSIDNNEESEIDISFIPLVILFVLMFVGAKLQYKRRK